MKDGHQKEDIRTSLEQTGKVYIGHGLCCAGSLQSDVHTSSDVTTERQRPH